ncbi:regulatory protein, tetR family [Micromonospora pallida]|uniref:Regulatory protein, tetR family n=1 Tax=Micromonospora pallida TaxID=145854 RepID=A0A1C6S4R0_9ACTN|nr:TetR/AcrR family transcriptional regulator [Micromonospora pallida]SCL24456.1 regulatory protein, tetR family [Micromonospora pallida]
MPGRRARESGEPVRQLSRERVLQAAVGIADARGLGGLTMRSLAAELDAKPMSLYHYIQNKDELLDALVDGVFAEIELPKVGGDWRAEVRRRSLSARTVLTRHPWALALVESRTSPGPATLRHHDAMLGTLRAGGFSLQMTAHAYALVDAYVYGFVLQEASLPFDNADSANAVTETIMESFAAGEYPHLVELATQHVQQPGYHFGGQFEFGLDLILDALAVHGTTRPS